MLEEWLRSGWSIVLVIFGLGLIIFLHELGHFLMAKKNKVKVEIFSLGFALNIPALVLWRKKWGETEYRICAVPFGGYVKMAGETLMDEQKGEPWELTSKTPWQRFQIFVAGALMNLIIAFPIGIAAYAVGKYEHTNEVGRPGTAETRAGLLPGDVVIEVDGRKIENMDKFRIEMVRRSNGVKVPVKVLRNGEPKILEVETMRSPYHFTAPLALALPEVKPGSPLEQQGVQKGDELVAVEGTPILFDAQADEILRNSPGKKVKVSLRRRDPSFNDPPPTTVTLDLLPKTWWVVPVDERLMEPIVGRVLPGNPAFEFLEPMDRIVQVGDKPVKSWADLKSAVEPSVNKKLAFTVERAGERKTVEFAPSFGPTGKGAIGIEPRYTDVIADVDPESYFGKAGLKAGDIVYSSVQGTTGERTLANSGILQVRKADEAPLSFQVLRGKEREKFTITLKPERRDEADLAKAGFFVDDRGILRTAPSQPFRRRAFGEAVSAGVYEPYDVAIMTFEILKKLAKLEESAKGLSGPLGIIHASYSFAQLSFGNFLWLLCLITVNLGIFNLLPIPILDGGHNVLLLIEVIRKKFGKPPPSPNFVAAFQWTGLIFVLALFVFVTFNDIGRMIGRG
jgi:regulator of sigma E protease